MRHRDDMRNAVSSRLSLLWNGDSYGWRGYKVTLGLVITGLAIGFLWNSWMFDTEIAGFPHHQAAWKAINMMIQIGALTFLAGLLGYIVDLIRSGALVETPSEELGFGFRDRRLTWTAMVATTLLMLMNTSWVWFNNESTAWKVFKEIFNLVGVNIVAFAEGYIADYCHNNFMTNNAEAAAPLLGSEGSL